MNIDNTERQRFIEKQIFNIHSNAEFEALALEIFRYQFENNKVYNTYIKALGKDVSRVSKLTEIPFLPIRFFKSHKVVCGDGGSFDAVFKSSTTTGSIPSQHFVKDVELYKKSFRKGFADFYGDVRQYCILALLPSYLEKGDSSLVYMVNDLIKDSHNPDSGFYMHNYLELADKLRENEASGQKTFLIGVTYALLRLAEEFPMVKFCEFAQQ